MTGDPSLDGLITLLGGGGGGIGILVAGAYIGKKFLGTTSEKKPSTLMYPCGPVLDKLLDEARESNSQLKTMNQNLVNLAMRRD